MEIFRPEKIAKADTDLILVLIIKMFPVNPGVNLSTSLWATVEQGVKVNLDYVLNMVHKLFCNLDAESKKGVSIRKNTYFSTAL